jgi:hypothetical protein
MPHRLALGTVALLLITISLGCTSRDDQTYYWQHDPNASLVMVRTYAVERNVEPAMRDEQRRVIEAELDRQMAAKGYTRAEPGRQADIVVRYYGDLERTALAPPPTVHDYTRKDAPAGTAYVALEPSTPDRPLPNRREGRLVVEVLNSRTGAGIWRGTVEQALAGNEPSEQRLREAVAGVMKHFPAAK